MNLLRNIKKKSLQEFQKGFLKGLYEKIIGEFYQRISGRTSKATFIKTYWRLNKRIIEEFLKDLCEEYLIKFLEDFFKESLRDFLKTKMKKFVKEFFGDFPEKSIKKSFKESLGVF